MKGLKKLKWTLVLILSGLSFLGGLTIGIPLLFGIIIWNTSGSIYVTQYIYAALGAFFLIFMSILPYIRRIFTFLKIQKINPFDILATILLVIVSAIPLFFLSILTLVIFFTFDKLFKKPPYMFMHYAALVALFLLGTMIRNTHGKYDPRAKVIAMNHTSPLDYLISAIVTMGKPWNAIAGINLKTNKRTAEDKIVSWLIGDLVAKYSISVDRDDDGSRQQAMKGVISEISNGKCLVFFPEGGRTPIKEFKNGMLLRPFHEKVFKYAWKRKLVVQSVVLDCPIAWRGKNDTFWGIHPSGFDIHYLNPVNPEDYANFEEFLSACWNPHNKKLHDSIRIKRFLKS